MTNGEAEASRSSPRPQSGVQQAYELAEESRRRSLEELGAVYTELDQARNEHPELVKDHLGKLIPISDWNEGRFLHLPRDVTIPYVVQAPPPAQVEGQERRARTLIVAEEGSTIHYLSGCPSPIYTSNRRQVETVEIFAKPGSRVRFTSIENWSKGIGSEGIARALVEAEAMIEWMDVSLGSSRRQSSIEIQLTGRKARGEIRTMALFGAHQKLEAAPSVIHQAPETLSELNSLLIGLGSGRVELRSSLAVLRGATRVRSKVVARALLADSSATVQLAPEFNIEEAGVDLERQEQVSELSQWLADGPSMPVGDKAYEVVCRFLEPLTDRLPKEFAVELHNLLRIELESL